MTRRHKFPANLDNFFTQGMGWSKFVKNSENVPCLIKFRAFTGFLSRAIN